MRGFFFRACSVVVLSGVLSAGALTGSALAQEPDGGDDKDSAADMHALAQKFSTARVKKDYSYIRYRPPGDRIVEQPETDRLLFWTRDGQPDGYAQRRGSSVIYYDAAGRAVRVQRLAPGEGE